MAELYKDIKKELKLIVGFVKKYTKTLKEKKSLLNIDLEREWETAHIKEVEDVLEKIFKSVARQKSEIRTLQSRHGKEFISLMKSVKIRIEGLIARGMLTNEEQLELFFLRKIDILFRAFMHTYKEFRENIREQSRFCDVNVTKQEDWWRKLTALKFLKRYIYTHEDRQIASFGNIVKELVKQLEKKPGLTKFIKADMHFHPALPKNDILARMKARQYWKYIEEIGLDVIAVTEHSNENPQRAYNMMVKTKPKHLKTVVFPGIEIDSIEGAHVVVIGSSGNFYFNELQDSGYPQGKLKEETRKFQKQHPEGANLLYLEKRFYKYKAYTINELADIARQRGFKIFIAHPYHTGTGAVGAVGEEKLQKILQNRVIGISAHLAGWGLAGKIFAKLGLYRAEPQINYLVRKLLWFLEVNKENRSWKDRIKDIDDTPNKMLKPASFVVSESDAHSPKGMGSHIQVPVADFGDPDKMFAAIMQNKTRNVVKGNTTLNRKSAEALIKNTWVGFLDTVDSAFQHMSKQKTQKKKLKQLVELMKNPEVAIKDKMLVKNDMVGSNIIKKAWSMLTSEQKKNVSDVVKARLAPIKAKLKK